MPQLFQYIFCHVAYKTAPVFSNSVIICQRQPPSIPSPLVVAYASWGQCDDNITRAALHGANVIIWFSINLESDNGVPRITGSLPPADCVAKIAKDIQDAGRSVLHLVSIGGWNAPLPNTSNSAGEWFNSFVTWNEREYSRPRLGWYGFDGIDWDPEGNDDPDQIQNHPTHAHLTLIGELSVHAKQAGYIVSLAPSQSYLDSESSQFDIELNHAPSWKPDFHYHGRNWYAYWLAFYGHSKLPTGLIVPTFDWISIQLYEGWSRANDALASRGIPFDDYLFNLVEKMDKGWDVDFGDLGGRKTISVSRDRLVIGLANGWTQPYPPERKFLFISPYQLRTGWNRVKTAGFMFWTIAEEGKLVNGSLLYLAKELANILQHN